MARSTLRALGPALVFCAMLPATAHAETITVLPCGFTPVATTASYSGLVTITVSGTMVNTPGNPTNDAFYHLAVGDPSTQVGQATEWLRYNRVTEGTCLCGLECLPTSHRVTDILVALYPPFDASHVYTVALDLGNASAEPLHFGIYDCGCFDNSGQFTLSIEPVTTTTTTTTTTTSSTTTTTLPGDADGDSVLDVGEPIYCRATAAGVPVTALGCSLEQTCPCTAPLGRASWSTRREYMACVRGTTLELVIAGKLTTAERKALLRAARASGCGNK